MSQGSHLRFSPRTLVLLDMAWLGPRIIVIEYFLGVVGCAIFGMLALRGEGWSFYSGVWLLCIAINYVPLLAHAIWLVIRNEGPPKRSELNAWTRPELARYRSRQLLILVPFAIVWLFLRERS